MRLRTARTCCHGRGWRRSHACRHRCCPPLGAQVHEREGVLNQSISEGSRKSGSGSHRGPLDRCPRRPDPDANVAFQVAGMYHSRFRSCIVKGSLLWGSSAPLVELVHEHLGALSSRSPAGIAVEGVQRSLHFSRDVPHDRQGHHL